MRIPRLAMALLVLFGIATAAPAAVIYSNGPYDGQNAATPLDTGSTADSFVLSAPATVTGIAFLEWCGPGENPISVDWAVLDGIPGSGTVLASGTAVTGGTFLYLNSAFYGVYSIDFAVTPLFLGSGTYWLQLDNVQVADFGVGFWDINGGPSEAWNSVSGDITTCTEHPSGRCSHSFAIEGTVPEARSAELTAGALVLMAIFGTRRKMRQALIGRRIHEKGIDKVL